MRSAWIGLLLGIGILHGENLPSNLVPQAPLQDFFLPSFNANGVKVWDARGEEALFSPDQREIRLRNIYIRLFDEKNDNALKVVIESSEACIDTQKNDIDGQNFIHMAGHLFTGMADCWNFDAEKRFITLRDSVQVFFETDLGRTLAGMPAEMTKNNEEGFTAISSDILKIQDRDGSFCFNFSENVTVKGTNFEMECDQLEIKTSSEAPIVFLDQTISSEEIRNIHAIGHVHLVSGNREIKAQSVEFFPESALTILSGKVELKDENQSLHGQRIVLKNREQFVVIDQEGVERYQFDLDL